MAPIAGIAMKGVWRSAVSGRYRTRTCYLIDVNDALYQVS